MVISKSTNNTIAVTSGSCYDSEGDVVLKLTNSTTKQNESQAASTTYYVYIIGNTAGSSIDILISSSSSSPTMPTGYTKYRQIGSYTTNSEGKIDLISYYGVSSTSDKGVSGVLNACMPDYTAGISITTSNTPYTVPAFGTVIYWQPSESNSEISLYINDNLIYRKGGGAYSGYGFTAYVPVCPGDVFTFSAPNITPSITFYPYKGAS